MKFKYDITDFFVNFVCFLTANVLVFVFMYYVMHFPFEILIQDVWPMVMRSVVIAGMINLYLNTKRVYDLLNRIANSGKEEKEKKLVKAQPQYRQVPINSSESEVIQ